MIKLQSWRMELHWMKAKTLSNEKKKRFFFSECWFARQPEKKVPYHTIIHTSPSIVEIQSYVSMHLVCVHIAYKIMVCGIYISYIRSFINYYKIAYKYMIILVLYLLCACYWVGLCAALLHLLCTCKTDIENWLKSNTINNKERRICAKQQPSQWRWTE